VHAATVVLLGFALWLGRFGFGAGAGACARGLRGPWRQRLYSELLRRCHYYPPARAGGRPVGPYIGKAAGRFGMPEQWIRAVMAQESVGAQQAVSSAGAFGLKQVTVLPVPRKILGMGRPAHASALGWLRHHWGPPAGPR